MKNRRIGLIILTGALLLSLTLPTFTAGAAATPKKVVVQIKRNIKKTRRNIVKGVKHTNVKVKQQTRTVKHTIKKDVKTTKVKMKNGGHGFIQNIKNFFK